MLGLYHSPDKNYTNTIGVINKRDNSRSESLYKNFGGGGNNTNRTRDVLLNFNDSVS